MEICPLQKFNQRHDGIGLYPAWDGHSSQSAPSSVEHWGRHTWPEPCSWAQWHNHSLPLEWLARARQPFTPNNINPSPRRGSAWATRFNLVLWLLCSWFVSLLALWWILWVPDLAYPGQGPWNVSWPEPLAPWPDCGMISWIPDLASLLTQCCA